MRRSFAVILLAAAPAAPASAQIAWQSPALIGPAAPSGVSLFVIDPAGGDLGGLVTFRHDAGPVGLGYRLAIADEAGPDGDIAISGGVDISGFLTRGVEGSLIDVVWWSGGGVGIGDETLVSIPLGLLLGASLTSEDVTLSPYGGAHLSLDISTVDDDNVDLSGAVDVGLDVTLPSGWLVRFGATVGDREALALGVRLPT